MRVVLDTNVVVSRYLNPSGAPAQIINLWQQDKFDLVVSEAILVEYKQVLGYEHLRSRHHLSSVEIDVIIEDFREFSIRTIPERVLMVVKEDPDDNIFLECAIAGNAEYIVSGDPHLLKLGSYKGIQILTPASFLSLVS